MKKLFLLLCATAWGIGDVHAQFSANNLAVLEAASATANNTTGSIVELNKTTASQTAANAYVINGTTGTNALRFSGSATSTGYLSNSNDGSLLLFTGGNTTSTSGNINTVVTRGVGAYNAGGTYSLVTSYTGASGNQTRCATTLNNTDYFIADQGGIFTNNAAAASPAGNYRGVKSFGGVTYVAASSSTAAIIQVNTVSALTGGTVTGLPGLTHDANIQDFYLVQSGSNGSSYDELYVLYATSNTAGSIAKYSLVSGLWTANGSYTTTFGGFGLAAEPAGTGANLYVTTGQGALSGNSVMKLTDLAGYNAPINIVTANNITLYTAATGAVVKGIAFAPIVAPTLNVTPNAIASTFVTSVNTTSASDSITVSGTHISGNVLVTAPASFEVSVSSGGTYGTSVSLVPSSGTLAPTKVHIRFHPTVTGTVSGNVVVSATGTTSQNVAVTGATPGPVVLASLSAITATFMTTLNTASITDSFTISGTNLGANVVVTAPSMFEVATALTGPYAASVSYIPSSGMLSAAKVYVRFLPTVAASAGGNVVISTTGATSQNVAVNGAILPPSLGSSGTIAASFSSFINSHSASDSFTVSATALTAPLTVTAPVHFEVAGNLAGPYSNSVVLNANGAGTIVPTTIYARFAPLSAGVFNDTIRLSSAGASSVNVPVTGFTIQAINPTAHDLSSGNYFMTQWDSSNAAGTYPSHMIFHTTNNGTPALTSSSLINNWNCAYNLSSRPRVKGLDGDGFSMINTGNPQYDNCSSGATSLATYMGGALLAVNTMGQSTITLQYHAGLVKQGDGATARVYNLRLQYRLDSVSVFTDMSPLAEYTSLNKPDGDLQVFSIVLPASFENLPYVEFRWLYYADTSIAGASGTRPEIRLDDIMVSVPTNGVPTPEGAAVKITAYPNPVKAGEFIHFSKTISGAIYDMYGRMIRKFENTAELSTERMAAGIYLVKTTADAPLRVLVK